MSRGPAHYWIVDRVVDAEAAERPLDLIEAEGCYTTARISAGEPTLATYHCRRLRRDASALGLVPPPDEAVLRALCELGLAEFGRGVGIVQLRAVPAESTTVLIGTPRRLGAEPATWRAVRTPFPHPGPSAHPGAKLTHRERLPAARAYSDESGVDEALLFDADDRLVEGARSNLVIVDARGRLVSPDPGLGAVAGIALECLRDSGIPLAHARLGTADLADAREVIALNGVRGACPIVEIDGRPVGDGKPGPGAASIEVALPAA